jgi:predicted acyltransferase
VADSIEARILPIMSSTVPTPSTRLASMDAYRGFVMLLMMGEVLSFGSVSRALPESGFWKFLNLQQSHVPWTGCVLHDMIQPSFSFLVGVALPFSIAARSARGQSQGKMTLHALGRALILVLLGVALRSTGSSQTRWTFEDTLSQIGLGYGVLFVLGWQSVRAQWIALVTILVGYWAAFAAYPLPDAGFDYGKVAVSADWLREHGLNGFAAHWQKNSNLAWAADGVILNWFPRTKPWVMNDGGYSTLSFIPTLGTMVLGLIAGGVLRGPHDPKSKMRWLLIAGAISLFVGWLLGVTGVCPVVKRIWTPSWVLFSGGICLWFLAAFYALVDFHGLKGPALPLRVIGMNSIAAYCIAHLWEGFISKNLLTHLGASFFAFAGAAYEPFFHGAAVLFVEWLVLYWMYRRQVFLRI